MRPQEELQQPCPALIPLTPCSPAPTQRPAPQLGVAIVVVGFPATPLITARMRVCISASHSRADLDFALEMFEALADRCCLRYGGAAAPDPKLIAAATAEA